MSALLTMAGERPMPWWVAVECSMASPDREAALQRIARLPAAQRQKVAQKLWTISCAEDSRSLRLQVLDDGRIQEAGLFGGLFQ